VLVVLHLLGPGACTVAEQLQDISADALELVLGELALQIRQYPWRRRGRSYAANLLMDTRRPVVKELCSHHRRSHPRMRELPMDPGGLSAPLLVGGRSTRRDRGYGTC